MKRFMSTDAVVILVKAVLSLPIPERSVKLRSGILASYDRTWSFSTTEIIEQFCCSDELRVCSIDGHPVIYIGDIAGERLFTCIVCGSVYILDEYNKLEYYREVSDDIY